MRSMSLVGVSWSRVEASRGEYDLDELASLSRALRERRGDGDEPVVVLHSGALPDWSIARGGWLDPDVLAAWSCYVDRVAQAVGVHVGHYLTFDGLLAEAEWYDADAPRVARTLVEAHAAAYLHLRRSSGVAGRHPDVGVLESAPPGLACPPPVGALLRVLASGRWQRPFGRIGELPNGSPCLDVVGARDATVLAAALPLGLPVVLVGVSEAEARAVGVRVAGAAPS